MPALIRRVDWLLGLLVIGAGLLAPSGARGVGPVDLSRMPDPAELCRALTPLGLDPGPDWRESKVTRGGWICSRARGMRKIGPPGPEGYPSDISYMVYGSGPARVDRILLEFTLRNPAAAAEGQALLQAAAQGVASTLEIKLSPVLTALLVEQPIIARPDWRPSPGDTGRHLVHEERQGWVRIRLEAERTRIGALILSFVSPDASEVWK